MSIEIRMVNVHKAFRGGRDQILKGVDLTFPKGELTYLLGPSGTGKSVSLKLILGLLKPDQGEVWVGDKEISRLNGKELYEHRMCFGMLFQNSALFDDMTIFENVAFPLREHTKLGESEIKQKVEKALSILDMPGPYDKFPNEISGGMKKRVALARAIIRQPSVLLYDEPTTGLDPVTRGTVDELIEKLKREFSLTSLVVSHDIPSALLLADRIVFLYQGHTVFSGKPKDFRNADHPAIQAFLKAEYRSVEAMQAV